MRLTFCGSRADGIPADQLAEVLRTERIERFSGDRKTHFIDLDHQFACPQHAFGHLERVVHVRIIDEAFPSGDGSRLFKVDAHHGQNGFGNVLGQLQKSFRIFERGLRVVDRARSGNNKKPIVDIVENLLNICSAPIDGFSCRLGQRSKTFDFCGRGHRRKSFNIDVF